LSISRIVSNEHSTHSIFGEMNMGKFTRISIAIACALGVTAVSAQTVQRDGKEVKPAQTRAPVKVAQAPAGGGAATGGATGGAVAGGISGGAIAAIAVGVALVAVAANDSDPATSH
jgi:uncharacterized membrane protein